MELLYLAVIALVAGIFAAPFLAIAALRRTASLRAENQRLGTEIDRLRRQIRALGRRLDLDVDDRPVEERLAPGHPTEDTGPGEEAAAAAAAETVARETRVTGGLPPVRARMAAAQEDATRELQAPSAPEEVATTLEGTEAVAESGEEVVEGAEEAAESAEGVEAAAEGAEEVAEALEDSRGEAALETPSATEVIDFETVIGSTWLLRIGLGVLAIALALFARSVAPYLSPGMKVTLAYAGSIAFFGVGKLFEERLEKFARPVMAAGLAFGFFVAFAAYFVPAMRAVPMAVSIAWMAVGMVAVLVAAERWESEATGILAIVLGHISGQVVAGDADLYSLVMIAFLAFTAIVLLLRHSWVLLGMTGVAASYGAHLLWLMADRAPVPGDVGFWLSLAFLTSYYAIFLVADVLWWHRHSDRTPEPGSRTLRDARALGPTNLVLYASLTTFVYVATGAGPESIAWYYLTLGALQGPLAWFYRDMNHRDFVFYPVFGMILWTLGLFAWLDALVLNLVLAAQALLLLVAAHRTRLRVFHLLAQALLAVAFIHYVAYPRPSAVTVGVFLGGLGIAAVYLLQAALEDIWYADGVPGSWFGDEPSRERSPGPEAEAPREDTPPQGHGSPSEVRGRLEALDSAVSELLPYLAPTHAVLGGIVLIRESVAFLGYEPTLAAFVALVQLILVGVVLARGTTVLLFTVTSLVAGAVWLGTELPWLPTVALIASFAVSGFLLSSPQRQRPRPGDRASVLLFAQAMAALSLVAVAVAAAGLDSAFPPYLPWMAVTFCLLLLQHRLDGVLVSEGASGHITEDRASQLAVVGYALYLAGALLIVQLTVLLIGRVYTAPVWIAVWATLVLGVSSLRNSRGLFISGYATLFGGYAVLLAAPGAASLRYSDVAALTFATAWAGAVVVLAPLALAVGMDRRLDQARDLREKKKPWNVALVLTFLPYLLGIVLVGGYASTHLSLGWAYAVPAVVGLALALGVPGLETPRAAAAVGIAMALMHLQFLGKNTANPALATALAPLLVASIATLGVERQIRARLGEDRLTIDRGRAALVVLATLTAMTAVYRSDLVGIVWATAGWSVLAGAMMAAGFRLGSPIHRRVALGVLGVCLIRVFVFDTVGLSDAARIGAFLVLGMILVGIALLYTRHSERLKRWL
ncbi:MAG TPA: DUF2339 domain-containing protein [Longimicrobiales bacterium]|nr:DUF2339 domain-containing protein [Longimicrobiales bacterium]